MNSSPCVSVIIATYGRAELLFECIASIVQNCFTDFEILVIDQAQCSTLRQKLDEKFPREERIRYIFSERVGLSIARNKGLEMAQGKFIVCCDDDVETAPDWLQAYVDAFTSIRPMPGIVAGQIEPLWLSPKPEWFPNDHREHLLGVYWKRGEKLISMPEGEWPIGANFAFQQKLLDKIGSFDERVGFSYERKHPMIAGEDSLFSLNAKRIGYSIYYQPRAKVMHKISTRKLTRKQFLKRNFWQGVSTIAVMHLGTSLNRENLQGIIQHHYREILRQGLYFVLPFRSSLQQSYMGRFATLFDSLGILYASRKLLRNQNFLE